MITKIRLLIFFKATSVRATHPQLCSLRRFCRPPWPVLARQAIRTASGDAPIAPFSSWPPGPGRRRRGAAARCGPAVCGPWRSRFAAPCPALALVHGPRPCPNTRPACAPSTRRARAGISAARAFVRIAAAAPFRRAGLRERRGWQRRARRHARRSRRAAVRARRRRAGSGRARRHARRSPAAGGGPCAPWAAGMRWGAPGGARASSACGKYGGGRPGHRRAGLSPAPIRRALGPPCVP